MTWTFILCVFVVAFFLSLFVNPVDVFLAHFKRIAEKLLRLASGGKGRRLAHDTSFASNVLARDVPSCFPPLNIVLNVCTGIACRHIRLPERTRISIARVSNPALAFTQPLRAPPFLIRCRLLSQRSTSTFSCSASKGQRFFDVTSAS